MRLGKILLATLVAGGVALGMVSCKKDDKNIPDPVIKFEDGNGDAYETGVDISDKAKKPFIIHVTTDEATSIDKVSISVKMKSKDGQESDVLKDLKLEKQKDDKKVNGAKEAFIQVCHDKDGTKTKNKINLDKIRDLAMADKLESIELTVTVIDKDKGNSSKTLKGNEQITWEGKTTAGGNETSTTKKFEKVNIDGVLYHLYGSGNGAFSFSQGAMKLKDVEENPSAVTIINTSENGNTFAKGFSSEKTIEITTTTTGKVKYHGDNTEFMLYTLPQGKTIKDIDVVEATKNFNGQKTIDNVEKGKMYIAKTPKDVFYLMEITEVDINGLAPDATNKEKKGVIKFNLYKAQE